MKITFSWFIDLVKLDKIKFVVIFTYTNDYEDKIGIHFIIKTIGREIFFLKIMIIILKVSQLIKMRIKMIFERVVIMFFLLLKFFDLLKKEKYHFL